MSESLTSADPHLYRQCFDVLSKALEDWRANDRRSELCIAKFSQITKLDTSKMSQDGWGVLRNFEKIDVLINQNRLKEFSNILRELGGILERYNKISQAIKNAAIQMQKRHSNSLIPYERMALVRVAQPSAAQCMEWALDIAKRCQKEYLERVQIFNRIRYEELDSIESLVQPWINKPIHLDPGLIKDYIDRCTI